MNVIEDGGGRIWEEAPINLVVRNHGFTKAWIQGTNQNPGAGYVLLSRFRFVKPVSKRQSRLLHPRNVQSKVAQAKMLCATERSHRRVIPQFSLQLPTAPHYIPVQGVERTAFPCLDSARLPLPRIDAHPGSAHRADARAGASRPLARKRSAHARASPAWPSAKFC